MEDWKVSEIDVEGVVAKIDNQTLPLEALQSNEEGLNKIRKYFMEGYQQVRKCK